MTEDTGIEDLSHEEIVESMIVSARSIVRTCMEIRNHEDVVIITDTHTSEIGRALYEAAAEVTDRVLLLMIPPAFKPGNEPPSPVGDLMRKSRVVLIATRESLTHTKARINASKSGVRIASMPGISKEMFITGGITADYNALQIEISGMNNVFRRRREVHVMTPSGTDVKFTTGSRWILEDNGICNRPGQVTNLPAGRIFTMPKEGTMQGKIVFDGSWEGELLAKPVEMKIVKGKVTEISGYDGVEDIIESFNIPPHSKRILDLNLNKTVSEFGFGMNSRAKVVGNVLEDQVVRGNSYFSFGDNTALGGSSNTGIQKRGVVKKSTVLLEDMDLVLEGKIIARKRK
jgi:leucyl aminopeptidase (aminopeptidase T)